MDKLKFGERYTIRGMMVRRGSYRHPEWHRSGFKPGEALYIGYRTLYDGDVDQGEDYTSFTPTSHQQVYLFVINERRNPIYVHPEDVVK